MKSSLIAAPLIAASLLIPAHPHPAQQPEQAGPDLDDLVRECQQPVRGRDYIGVVWWMPSGFWELSASASGRPDQDAQAMVNALGQYTIVAVAIGKKGGPMRIEWVPGADLHSKTFLRDSKGVEYAAIESVSPEAQVVAAVFRPILSSIIGKMGENTELIFFPSKTKEGVPIADGKTKGTFSVVLRALAGPGEKVFEWKLPLTSLLPPKICPVGKERVNANWNYCPWHGVALN